MIKGSRNILESDGDKAGRQCSRITTAFCNLRALGTTSLEQSNFWQDQDPCHYVMDSNSQ